jgi:hypothetical protein
MSYLRRFAPPQLTAPDLPFDIQFNFKALIDWWKAQAATPNSPDAHKAKRVIKQIEDIPELCQPFHNLDLIERHQEKIQLLLSPFFPSLTTTNEIKAVSMPFNPVCFNLTKRFSTILDAADGHIGFPPMRNAEQMYIFACLPVLNRFYGTNIQYGPSLFFDIPDAQTGLVRRYRFFINADFTELIPVKPLEPLTRENIEELLDHFGEVELWKQKIKPGRFSYQGFTILTLFDVTREESISALEFDLLKKDALVTSALVDRIRVNLSSLLTIADLQMGIVSYRKERDVMQSLSYDIRNSLVLSKEREIKTGDVFCQFAQASLLQKQQALILSNTEKSASEHDALVKILAEKNIKTYVAVPLVYNEEPIGLLELGSTQPNILNAVAVQKLQDVIPLFTTALNRSLEEKENRVEAIIQQKFTAIHPTVQWRFIQAAENLLEQQQAYGNEVLEDLVFDEVYALYGQADIQNSSMIRNQAIQADLIEQLSFTKDVLEKAINEFGLPLYQEQQFRVAGYIQQLQNGLSAGDENSIVDYLHSEIHPVFRHLEEHEQRMQPALTSYYQRSDQLQGAVYKQRKSYEQSVKMINDKVSHYLDHTQLAAQRMFPHYFEKYKTDGVEYNLYIGQSMVNDKAFHLLYLKNLRLWQLLVMCEIENLVHLLKEELPTKLEICSLILVHSTPLSIRFRTEEKKFDVDGTYNARYAIIKKRIDKAYTKEENIRLTQPGKIAIVYAQDKEALEYLQYLQYLQSIGYVGPDVEWLTLKDLQGVVGLKALRVAVTYNKNFKGLPESKIEQVLASINE